MKNIRKRFMEIARAKGKEETEKSSQSKIVDREGKGGKGKHAQKKGNKGLQFRCVIELTAPKAPGVRTNEKKPVGKTYNLEDIPSVKLLGSLAVQNQVYSKEPGGEGDQQRSLRTMTRKEVNNVS